jgi:sugar fermentation stimulation protein A
MNLPQPLEEACFRRRVNRFAAEVVVGRQSRLAHVPNSGRLNELLTHGARVYVHPAARSGRKTSHDLLLVEFGGHLVSIDSRAPAAIAAEAVLSKGVPPAPRADELRREVPLGDRRLDLWLRSGREEWLIEVKGCTLVVDGTALFPDAPTVRGRRHVEALTDAAARGKRTMVLFVIQREDARRFGTNSEGDPDFAAALAAAAQAGVNVAAYTCTVTLDSIELSRPVSVHLSGEPPAGAQEHLACG